MDIIMMLLTALGTIASIISAIIAVMAKNKTQEIQKRMINNLINIETQNNRGQIVGINNGDIINEKKR